MRATLFTKSDRAGALRVAAGADVCTRAPGAFQDEDIPGVQGGRQAPALANNINNIYDILKFFLKCIFAITRKHAANARPYRAAQTCRVVPRSQEPPSATAGKPEKIHAALPAKKAVNI